MFHRRRMVAPINSIKHYVQMENSDIASGAKRTQNLVAAVGQASVAATQDVVEGSIIKAVYIEFWIHSEAVAGTENKFQLAIDKEPAGVAAMTFAQMNNMMAYPNKKNVLYFSQGVLGDLTTQSVPVFRDWLKIPKGKQRFGLGDELVLTVSATGAVFASCGFAVFKEYK